MVMPNGRRMKLTLFRVQTRYEDVTLIPEDMTCELSTDVTKNEFILAYTPEKKDL
jgi:hypothetical protein